MKQLIERLGRGRFAALMAAGAAMAAILFATLLPARERTPSMPAARWEAPASRSEAAAKPVAAIVPVAARMSTPAPAAEGEFVVRRILQIDKPLRHGDWVWHDEGAPAGPIVITVDLKAEMMSVFRDGYEIGTAVVNYGDEAYMTPLGTFPITQKDADHSSNIYDAKMPYMLRLTNDGVTIHGAVIANNHATHGCIGVPTAFARKLFYQVKLGDRVIVTRGKMMNLGDKIVRS